MPPFALDPHKASQGVIRSRSFPEEGQTGTEPLRIQSPTWQDPAPLPTGQAGRRAPQPHGTGPAAPLPAPRMAPSPGQWRRHPRFGPRPVNRSTAQPLDRKRAQPPCASPQLPAMGEMGRTCRPNAATVPSAKTRSRSPSAPRPRPQHRASAGAAARHEQSLALLRSSFRSSHHPAPLALSRCGTWSSASPDRPQRPETW